MATFYDLGGRILARDGAAAGTRPTRTQQSGRTLEDAPSDCAAPPDTRRDTSHGYPAWSPGVPVIALQRVAPPLGSVYVHLRSQTHERISGERQGMKKPRH